MRRELHLILHNIRSTHNVGSIFRTADGAGAAKVHLCGYTPDPVDRFGRTQKDIAKVALGAETSVPWEHVDDSIKRIKELKEKQFRIVALEQDARSVPYTSLVLDMPTAIVLGEEVNGIPNEILAQCDVIAEIPMYGKKESLNVSVAAGVLLYALRASSGGH